MLPEPKIVNFSTVIGGLNYLPTTVPAKRTIYDVSRIVSLLKTLTTQN